MKALRGDGGSGTLLALGLLLVLAAAAAGAARLLDFSMLVRARVARDHARYLELRRAAEAVVAALGADPTPASDSPRDPVWDRIGAPVPGGTSASLVDVSSAVNPNWVQKNLLTATGLRELLSSPGAADALQQRREDAGFFRDLEAAYGDLFRDGILARYGTPYGWANLNVTDEFALRRLYAERTGDRAGAELFHARVQQLLLERRILQRGDLRAFLGTAYDTLYPVVNVEPVMNVHYLDERLLAELLAWPAMRVPRPREASAALLSGRGSTEIAPADLRRAIGAPEDSRIYQYLGTTTWFWKLVVSRDGRTLEMVLARIPGPGEGRPAFHVVEERMHRS